RDIESAAGIRTRAGARSAARASACKPGGDSAAAGRSAARSSTPGSGDPAVRAASGRGAGSLFAGQNLQWRSVRGEGSGRVAAGRPGGASGGGKETARGIDPAARRGGPEVGGGDGDQQSWRGARKGRRCSRGAGEISGCAGPFARARGHAVEPGGGAFESGE